MSTILVREYIETGFSLDDAEKLNEQIEAALSQSKETDIITLDFNGVRFFTTQFFNNAIGKYVLEMGPDAFNARFEFIHLSDIGQATFQRSYDNAVSYFDLPPEKRLAQDDIIDQIEDV